MSNCLVSRGPAKPVWGLAVDDSDNAEAKASFGWNSPMKKVI